MDEIYIKKSIKKKGWSLIKNKQDFDEKELLEVGRILGVPVASRKNGPLIDKLKLQKPYEANPKSLSAIHGTGVFPLHTDTAHWRTPARFIMLYAKEIKSTCYPTILVDANKLDYNPNICEVMSRGIFAVKNGRKSFLTAIKDCSEKTKGSYIRYDQGCMRAANETGKNADEEFQELIKKVQPDKIQWEQGDLLIIDNWRCLHGRGELGTKIAVSSERLLYRVLISNNRGDILTWV